MRVLVTGSADGLGRAAAASLLAQGHDVVVHARNRHRAADLEQLVDQGAGLVIGDLADRDAVRNIAAELNGLAPVDSVIHNAGVSGGPGVMPVNVMAPYLLTVLLKGPGLDNPVLDNPVLMGPSRHVYLSSSSHYSGRASLAGVDWRGTKPGSYADSKLFLTALSAALARHRPDVMSNAVDPGWVPTKMGGAGAPDDFDLGHETQEWLAVSRQPEALTSGGYWYHRQRLEPHPAVSDTAFQENLLQVLAGETGVEL